LEIKEKIEPKNKKRAAGAKKIVFLEIKEKIEQKNWQNNSTGFGNSSTGFLAQKIVPPVFSSTGF